MRPIIKLLLSLILLCLTACGGGGGAGGGSAVDDLPDPVVTPEQAVASLTLTGGTDTLGALQFDLILPEGFSLETVAGGELASGVLTVHIADSTIAANYLPEDSLNLGQLSLGMIKLDGFAAGVFATLKHNLAAGEEIPLPADFSVANLLVVDLEGQEMVGYSLDISVQRQVVAQ